ncbi:MAG TPA: YbaB/EbfC family nucleoid-associated protein [Candidatus Stackebrandtia faecavium]|nr:YbaB/EbfC family nucleoid-associated protein [Candidatus Stackebrandtia faecavium]
MSRRDAVLALRQQILDARLPSQRSIDPSNVRAVSQRLKHIHFLTTGGGGNVRVLMNANRKLMKVAIRPGSLDSYARTELSAMVRSTIQEAESVLQETFDTLQVRNVS